MNNIDALILGLLNDRNPRNSYQIHRNLVNLGINWWARLGKSSVYFSLKKLKYKKFIEIVTVDDPEVPTKYQATYKGRRAFRDHFKKISNSIDHQDSFKAMLTLLPSLPKDERIDVLESRKCGLETQIWWLRDYKKDERKVHPFLENNNQLIINLYQTEVEWIDGTMERLKNKELL